MSDDIVSITLTGKQLKEALEFVNPDGDGDLSQLDEEVSVYEQDGKQYIFMTNYPDEGSMELSK